MIDENYDLNMNEARDFSADPRDSSLIATSAPRPLAICTFANEKSTTPKKSAFATWDLVIALNQKRRVRSSKSGSMLGGFALNGNRSNANVLYRSIIQLDIDTEGEKDKTTGQILRIDRAAPSLAQIRKGIDEFEWIAASSHWHEPQRGIIKYRIIMLPDRNILSDEWEAVLEALDQLLSGALDRGAWAWSQAFYLPSCPAQNQADAFVVHNQGMPLPVDEFVQRGDGIIKGRRQRVAPQAKRGNPLPVAVPETTDNVERVKEMLSAIDPDILYPEWRQACWSILATGWSCAEHLIREWSEGGQKFTDAKFTKIVDDFDPNGGTGFGTLTYIAKRYGWKEKVPVVGNQGISIADFCAYMPMHNYIFMLTGEVWPAASVNSRFPAVNIGTGKPMSPATWLDQNVPVEQMTWAPGEPQMIPGRLVSNGGWKIHPGANTFNLYHPPIIQQGGFAKQASPWLTLINEIYPNDFRHIVNWFAHRVQRPHEKLNHALLLGGSQGIGKDTILEPVKHAVGHWNFEEVSPQQLLGRFNGFVKSVILRISEARDLGDLDRYKLYEHMKTYTTAPPDVLRVDEKHLREHYVFNVTGVIITTNHKTDGIFLPPDDRRHYVAWSEADREQFPSKIWNDLWNWYENGGYAHVAAFLRKHDISSFNPKAPPPKTQAFLDIADANRAPEDAELADTIDILDNPDALTLDQLKNAASVNPGFYNWISDRKNRRAIPHRLETCGYIHVRNSSAKDGQWKVGGSRVNIYARKTLSPADRMIAAEALTI